MSLVVRPCGSVQELQDALAVIRHYVGRERPSDADAERWLKNFQLERLHAAVEGGRIVGGAGAHSLRLTVPGGVLPAAGVTVVGVLPTHRRRGILRAMMRAQLDDAHDRGEPLAVLWASEETIYGRYGYGLASLTLKLEVPRQRSEFRPGVERAGQPLLIEGSEALGALPPVYDAVQAVTPGMFERTGAWWEHRLLADPPEWRQGGGPLSLAVLEVEGAVQAYAAYRLNVSVGSLGPETTVRVVEALGTSPAATASIWRFLLDIDWTQAIAARLLPVDHPLLLLLARPSAARPTIADGIWVRLVDVGAALSGRSYSGEGSVVLGVRDSFCSWNEGRWKLADGEAARTDEEADLELDVADLGSVYLGGFTFRELSRAGRVEELTATAVGAGGCDLPDRSRALVPGDLLSSCAEAPASLRLAAARSAEPARAWRMRCESAWAMSSGALE